MCKYCDFQYTACHTYLKFIIVVLFLRRVHDYYVMYFVENIVFQLYVRPRYMYVKTFLLTLCYVIIMYGENHEIKGFFFGGGVFIATAKIRNKFGQKERDELHYSVFNTIFLFNSVTEYLIYTVVIIVLFMK